jgi:alpha-L-fucosidase
MRTRRELLRSVATVSAGVSLGARMAAQTATAPAAPATQTPKALRFGATRIGRRSDAEMARWRANRLGQILHFGLYSIVGGAWNGTSYDYAAEFIKETAKVSDADYNTLLTRFAPSRNAPAQWAAMAQEMGARYVVITTKHHDGFCLWPSRHTDFSVAATPYTSDFLGEYVAACDALGLDVMLYYSILDWHHPDWRYKITSAADEAAFTRLWQYSTNQLLELLERYPMIKGFWFDGTWDDAVKSHGQWSYELEQRLRAVNPDLVMGSRLRADETGARHFDANGRLMGDYEQGWERKLPDKPLENDWECVMTVPENQWGYHAKWTGHVKDTNEILEMAVQSVAYGGNFVLNIGPMGTGEIRAEEQTLVREIGAWMRVNSEAIYECGPSGLAKQDWGFFTRHNETRRVYAVVFNLPVSRVLKVALPKTTAIKDAWILGGRGAAPVIERALPGDYRLHLDQRAPAPTGPFVVALEVRIG